MGLGETCFGGAKIWGYCSARVWHVEGCTVCGLRSVTAANTDMIYLHAAAEFRQVGTGGECNGLV